MSRWTGAFAALAPYPNPEQARPARALAAWLAVDAGRRWFRNEPRPGFMPDRDDMTVMAAELTASWVLTALDHSMPGMSAAIAQDVIGALADGGAAGERLDSLLREHGIDPDRVARLEAEAS